MPTKPKLRSTVGKRKTVALPLKALAGEKSGALQLGDSVATAGRRMREHAAESWPVTEDRKLVGKVEEKNPDWRLGGRGHDPKSWRVGEIMSRELVYCFEDEDCAKARRLMEERHLHYLPVVDREMRIVGIFSREEIEEKAGPSSPRQEEAAEGGRGVISKL